MRRCWTLVSWACVSRHRCDGEGRGGVSLYQLRVELGQSWLAGIIEDEDCVDHGSQSD